MKGDRSFARDPDADALFEEIKRDGYTYSRFTTLEDLPKAVRERLVEHIRTAYDASRAGQAGVQRKSLDAATSEPDK